MLVKKGIVTTRETKNGPTVKQGISAVTNKKHTRTIICQNCKAKLEKSCKNELVCEVLVVKCPRCGAPVA